MQRECRTFVRNLPDYVYWKKKVFPQVFYGLKNIDFMPENEDSIFKLLDMYTII